MVEEPNGSGGEGDASPVLTVAQTVLTKFFDELGAVDGFSEIAPRLRRVILEEGSFRESDVRRALFGDGE